MISNTSRTIETRASLLIEELAGKNPPVDVLKIARKHGIEVIEHDLGTNVSGVLYIQRGKGIIGYNPNESEVRQRFTIAHELGHYFLHRLTGDIFVDQNQFRAMFRDEDSATGEIKQEREANAFAAALLMPRNLVIREIERNHLDLSDEDDAINKLAKKFKVSSQAMTFRIAKLNLF